MLARYLIAVGVVFLLFGSFGTAGAADFKVIHSFKQQHGGYFPVGGLAADDSGTIYGVTCGFDCAPHIRAPGKHCSKSCGSNAYVLQGSKESVIYSFHGGDGAVPNGPLLLEDGYIYGTTFYGGRDSYHSHGHIAHCGTSQVPPGCGLVFQLSPDGTETILHQFCSRNNCLDGRFPPGGLISDGSGALVGTAGGGRGPGGIVFRIIGQGETVVYDFCRKTNCVDGQDPSGRLVLGKSGDLYGGTGSGGAYGHGTIYRLSPDGTETVIYSFCPLTVPAAESSGYPVCPDGDGAGDLVSDSAGNLYGVSGGGSPVCACGLIFKITPEGKESVVYRFTRREDGASRIAPTLDPEGNFYVVGLGNGLFSDPGVILKVSPDGREKILHTFCSEPSAINIESCVDGEQPDGSLLLEGDYLFGITFSGGSHFCETGFRPIGCGVVFRVKKD